MDDVICRLSLDSQRKVRSENWRMRGNQLIAKLDNPLPKDINNVIESDKAYGLLKPKDGKSYGYIIMNSDVELTERQTRRAVVNGIKRWYFDLKFDFHRVTDVSKADLRYIFRSESEDTLLDQNTIAYMYFPLGSQNDGFCVINKRFYYTNSGNGVSMHEIDPVHYPEGTTAKLADIDLDEVLGHENGHGLLGLPHYPYAENVMYPGYSHMAEFVNNIDIARGQAKIPKRNWLDNKYKRMKDWFTHASER